MDFVYGITKNKISGGYYLEKCRWLEGPKKTSKKKK